MLPKTNNFVKKNTPDKNSKYNKKMVKVDVSD